MSGRGGPLAPADGTQAALMAAPAYRQTDVRALLMLLEDHFDSMAHELDVRWAVFLPETLQAQLDPQMLLRVVFSLVSNAFRFTPAGAGVRLSVAPRGERLVIEVADGGPGVPKEWREGLFEHVRPGLGLGLGLAMAREFAQCHGGHIAVSDAPEGGALFTVELPMSAPPGVSVAPAAVGTACDAALVESLGTRAPAAPLPAAGERPLVLVLEDDADTSAFICRSLADEWRVATAREGAQGLQQALASRPDLVIAGIGMTGPQGETLVRELRRCHALDDTPVLVIGARADDGMRYRLLGEGAQDYLLKPFVAEELRACVGSLLARAQTVAGLRRRENYWHQLFTQASDGILVGDAQCCVVEANVAACTLLGRSREAVVGTEPREWLVPAAGDANGRLLAELRGGHATAREWTVQRPDGSKVHVDVTATHLSDGRCIAVLRDAAPRRRREQAAEAMAVEMERRASIRTDELRRLAVELEMTESRERRQIARYLHDDLGQVLAAARIRLSALCNDAREDVRHRALEVSDLLEHANRATRSLAAQLAPAVLYELGLVPALQWLADEVEGHFGLHVEVHDDGEPKPLSQEARSILYRATRELLINVAKHARVQHADVSVARDGGVVLVTVNDGGVGFTPFLDGATPERRMGLVSVRERLSHIGGSLDIRSGPGDGTEATLQAPLEQAPA